MKTSAIIIFPGYILALFFATYVIKNFAPDDIGALGWVLLVTATLALTWLVATIFNLAIFAPVYWLLGRSAAKRNPPEKPRQPCP